MSFKTIAGVLLLLSTGYSVYITNKLNVKQENHSLSTAELWNKEITSKFPDDPDFKKRKDIEITSATNWIIPANPDVIKQNDYVQQHQDKTEDEKNRVEKDWNNFYSQDSKKLFEKFNLHGWYRDVLYYSEIVPFNVSSNDLIGNGKSEKITEGVGLGCASCHTVFITIFYNNKVYSTGAENGSLTPRADHKGFYLIDANSGNRVWDGSPNQYIISKYEWNGDGFTEIARKTVWFKNK
jgi:hypothetical protein